MTEKIFVSYDYDDRGVRRVLEKLEQILRKHGVIGDEPVSIIELQKEVKAGDNIREAIRSQIQSASKVIVIQSDKSESSQWVNYEAGMADALNKPIIVIGKKGPGKTRFLSNLANVRSIEIEESG
ncbi:MAG: toll/interleukin-1 receptor domain-containing protein [Parcubacteria group bacterium]